MATILGANTLSSGYDVANSCRFNDADGPNMTKTPGSSGNLRKWTWSCWVKRGSISNGSQTMFNAGSSSNTQLRFDSDDTINFYQWHSSSYTARLATNRKFKDVSAWYHIVAHWDTDNGTAGDRMKLFVNGVEETSFGTDTNPNQNLDSYFGASGTALYVGDKGDGAEEMDGYLAEMVFIDGQNLAPTSFGEFDDDSPQIWKPKDVSGLTFGTNGFYLDFEDSGNLGNDANGGTDLTENNIAATDQTTDTCTNNFCTFNPLIKQDHAFSEGNLKYTSSASDWDCGIGTIPFSSGKWYMEQKITAVVGGIVRTGIGICDVRDVNLIAENEFGYKPTGAVGDSIGYNDNAVHKNDSSVGSSWGDQDNGDVVQMAVDVDNGAVYFGLNGTWGYSGNPESGASKTGAITFTTGETYISGAIAYGGGTVEQNWGNPVSALSSGNSDANGYGNFEFEVPSGYYSLCTKNLAEYG